MHKALNRTLIALFASWVLLSPRAAAWAIEPEDKVGNWIGATSTLRYSERWSIFLQGELRTWEPLHNVNEVLWRVAGHYDFSKKYMVAFGYVRVDTWPYEASGLGKFDENRIFQEFLIKPTWGKAKVNHRFRLEQRWITTPESGTQYSNRVRYMLGFTWLLNGEKMKPGTWFAKTFNEVFVDLDEMGYWFNPGQGEAGLNQNRLYGGVGKQLTSSSKLQLGVLWQHRPDTDFWRLLISYSHNFKLRTEEK